jgi:hypothetical protein
MSSVSPSVIDFTGVLNSELAALKTVYDTDTTKIGDIITNLNNVQTTLNNNHATTANILSSQNDMENILANEQNRLNQKKDSINSYVTTQQRMMLMNDSYQKKYTMYTSIIIYITVVLVIILAITFIWRIFPFIPEGIIYLLYTILAIVSIPFIAYRVYQIRSRDPIYFDEIQQSNLPKMPVVIPPATPTSGWNLLESQYGTCIGQDCCTDGLAWSPVASACVLSGTPGAVAIPTTYYMPPVPPSL